MLMTGNFLRRCHLVDAVNFYAFALIQPKFLGSHSSSSAICKPSSVLYQLLTSLSIKIRAWSLSVVGRALGKFSASHTGGRIGWVSLGDRIVEASPCGLLKVATSFMSYSTPTTFFLFLAGICRGESLATSPMKNPSEFRCCSSSVRDSGTETAVK